MPKTATNEQTTKVLPNMSFKNKNENKNENKNDE
jgi:hypothetical protein